MLRDVILIDRLDRSIDYRSFDRVYRSSLKSWIGRSTEAYFMDRSILARSIKAFSIDRGLMDRAIDEPIERSADS